MTIARREISSATVTPTSYVLPAEPTSLASQGGPRPFLGAVSGHLWITGERYAQPMRVAVALEAEGVMLIEPTTGVFGMGRSMPEAVEDVRAALVEHVEVLEGSGLLSPDLSEHLSYLRRFIV